MHPHAIFRRTALLALIIGLLAAGCGTRDAEVAAPPAGVDPLPATATPSAPIGGGVGADDDVVGAPELDGAGAPGVPAPATPGGGAAPDAAPGTGPSAPGDPATPAPAAGAPLKIGVVGTHSGVGATSYGTVVAVQAWAKMINARGGIHGHPVEVLVKDDGGDASRFRAALRQLVEDDGVVAFVGTLGVFTLNQAAVDYLEEKQVPMIGGDRLSNLWYRSPMMFPQASAGSAAVWLHAHYTVATAGKAGKIGWLACTDTPLCRDSQSDFQRYFTEMKANVVYSGAASIFAPDYSPQCIQARNAGVTHFLSGLDVQGFGRLVDACARQGLKPIWISPQTAASMADVDELQGLRFASATFPWVSAATPAMAEFREAIATHAPRLELSGHASSGWVAAKLFERAAARVGPDPTPADILKGLWSIRDDTLGGLTAPLTFTRGQPAAKRFCYFPMSIEARGWVARATTPYCEARDA